MKLILFFVATLLVGCAQTPFYNIQRLGGNAISVTKVGSLAAAGPAAGLAAIALISRQNKKTLDDVLVDVDEECSHGGKKVGQALAWCLSR